jgi:hypothetical protein
MTETVKFFWPGREAELRNILDGFRPIAAAWGEQTEAAAPELRRTAQAAAAQR